VVKIKVLSENAYRKFKSFEKYLPKIAVSISMTKQASVIHRN